jgi:hypothetical protein
VDALAGESGRAGGRLEPADGGCGTLSRNRVHGAEMPATLPPPARRSAPTAFGGGAIIGALGGLIGLGGAEFRLPLLIGAFRFAALQAVILNKAMSLVVVASALPFRASTVPFSTIAANWPIIESAGGKSARCMGRGKLGNPARVAHPVSGHRHPTRRDRRCPAAWPRHGRIGGVAQRHGSPMDTASGRLLRVSVAGSLETPAFA